MLVEGPRGAASCQTSPSLWFAKAVKAEQFDDEDCEEADEAADVKISAVFSLPMLPCNGRLFRSFPSQRGIETCRIRCPLPLLRKSATALRVARCQCNTTKLKSATMANTSWWPSAAGHSDQRHKFITAAKWLPRFISEWAHKPTTGLPTIWFALFTGLQPCGQRSKSSVQWTGGSVMCLKDDQSVSTALIGCDSSPALSRFQVEVCP